MCTEHLKPVTNNMLNEVDAYGPDCITQQLGQLTIELPQQDSDSLPITIIAILLVLVILLQVGICVCLGIRWTKNRQRRRMEAIRESNPTLKQSVASRMETESPALSDSLPKISARQFEI